MHYFEEPIDKNPKYPCGICTKNIAKNQKLLRCNLCNYKVHIKCNKTDAKQYEKVKGSEWYVYCLSCKEEIIPFQKLTSQQFFATASQGLNKDIFHQTA